MLPITPPVLLERTDSLRLLERQRAAARAGKGSTVVLDAPAGLGKSSLLAQARRDASDAGFLVVHARGDELGRSAPNALLQQLLARLLRDVGAEQLAELARSPAAQLLTAIGPDGGELPIGPAHAGSGLWWLLDAMAERMDRTILVVVDDLQWVDGASLEAIAYVAARVDDMRCALLVAQRSGDRASAPEPTARVRAAAATTIEVLSPLSLAGCEQLARTIDPDIDAARVAWAWEATGGNPFLFSELVEHAAQRGTNDLPPRIADHVEIRLRQTHPDTTLVAAATAVLGQWATVARIAAVAELPVGRTERMLDELAELGIIDGARESRHFRHPLLREAVLAAAVDTAARRQLARRAADVASADGLEPGAIASLLLDAPIAGDQDTVRRLLTAARIAVDGTALAEATTFLERALAEPIEDTDERASAWLLLLQARTAVDDRQGAIDAATSALQHVRGPRERSDLHVTLANLRIGIGDIAGAMREFAAATSQIEDVPGTAARMAMLRAGEQSFGRFLSGDTVDEDPLLRAVDEDRSELTLETRILLGNLGLAHTIGNRDAARACAYARRALDGTTLLDLVGSDAQIFYVASAPLGWCEDFDAVFPAFDAAIADAQRRGTPIGFAMASASRGGAHLRRGELARAASDLDAAIEGRHDGWSAYLPMNGYMAARAHEELGDDRAVQATVETCLAGRDPGGWGALEPFAWDCLALAARSRGEDDRALELWIEAIAAARRERQGAITLSHWRHCAVELGARLGRGNEFVGLAAESLQLARALGSPWALGRALRASSAIAESDDERLLLLDEAIDVFAGGDIRLELARTLVRRAELVGIDSSEDSLVRALRIAADCGATRLVEELSTLGVVAPDRRIRDLLTPSELRVAELAARGRTNREIAGSLFITVKAVEWHLSNCYRKLEIAGRRELPSALASSAVVA